MTGSRRGPTFVGTRDPGVPTPASHPSRRVAPWFLVPFRPCMTRTVAETGACSSVRDVVGGSEPAASRDGSGASSPYMPRARLRRTSLLASALHVNAASAVVDEPRAIDGDHRPIGGFAVHVSAGPHGMGRMARSTVVKAVATGTTG